MPGRSPITGGPPGRKRRQQNNAQTTATAVCAPADRRLRPQGARQGQTPTGPHPTNNDTAARQREVCPQPAPAGGAVDFDFHEPHVIRKCEPRGDRGSRPVPAGRFLLGAAGGGRPWGVAEGGLAAGAYGAAAGGGAGG